MMEVVPFKKEHLLDMELQASQQHLMQFYDRLDEVDFTVAWTAFFDGKPKASAGMEIINKDYARLWAYLDKTAGKHMLAFYRLVKYWVNAVYFPRIDIIVAEDFEQGHRLAKMLGFSCEVERLDEKGLDGKYYALYARYK